MTRLTIRSHRNESNFSSSLCLVQKFVFDEGIVSLEYGYMSFIPPPSVLSLIYCLELKMERFILFCAAVLCSLLTSSHSLLLVFVEDISVVIVYIDEMA